MNMLLLTLSFALIQNGSQEAQISRPLLADDIIGALESASELEIDRLTSSIEYLPAMDIKKISAGEFVQMLKGCMLESESSFRDTYVLNFSCPDRAGLVDKCYTGNLRVLLSTSAQDRSIGLAERRKVSNECPLFVPVPMAPKTNG